MANRNPVGRRTEGSSHDAINQGRHEAAEAFSTILGETVTLDGFLQATTSSAKDHAMRLYEYWRSTLDELRSYYMSYEDRRRRWPVRLAEEAKRERGEERRLYQERAKRQQDKNRWRRFVELAARWEEAALAARFIEALTGIAGRR